MDGTSQSIELGFSLGSNLGDRLQQLQDAAAAILAYPDATLRAKSAVYETEPVGVKAEYKDLSYLNTVLVISTTQPAEVWLGRLQAIEADMGRVRGSDRFAPRTIDVDILFAGDRYADGKDLEVPHPRWAQRRFVVAPLADVRPDLVLPKESRTVADVLRALPEETEQVDRISEEW